jgi:hypothetical protein
MTDQQVYDAKDQTLRLRQLGSVRAELVTAKANLFAAKAEARTAHTRAHQAAVAVKQAQAAVDLLSCQAEDLVRLLCERAKMSEPVNRLPFPEAAEDSLGPGYCPTCKGPCKWEGLLHWCPRCQTGTMPKVDLEEEPAAEVEASAADVESPVDQLKAVCWLPEGPVEKDRCATLLHAEEALEQLAAYPAWWGRARDRTAEWERTMVEHRLRGIPHSRADQKRIPLITAWRMRQDQNDLEPRLGEWWEGAVILGTWELRGRILPVNRLPHVEVRYKPEGGCELEFWGEAVSETGYRDPS